MLEREGERMQRKREKERVTWGRRGERGIWKEGDTEREIFK